MDIGLLPFSWKKLFKNGTSQEQESQKQLHSTFFTIIFSAWVKVNNVKKNSKFIFLSQIGLIGLKSIKIQNLVILLCPQMMIQNQPCLSFSAIELSKKLKNVSVESSELLPDNFSWTWDGSWNSAENGRVGWWNCSLCLFKKH